MARDGHTLPAFDLGNIDLVSPEAVSPHAINAMGRKPSHGSPSSTQPIARLVTPGTLNEILAHA